jgi:hypothetical protein
MNQLNSSYEIIYAYDASPAYLNKIKGIIIGLIIIQLKIKKHFQKHYLIILQMIISLFIPYMKKKF